MTAHGIHHGIHHGDLHGVGRGGIAATKDATSGKFIPQNATEWAAILAAAGIGSGGPSSLWLMQEAAGNPADTIGTVTLTAAGTGLSYQNSVTGWSTKALGTTDAGTGNFRGSTGPSTLNFSILILGYVAVPTAASTRTILGYGNNLEHRVLLTTGFSRVIDSVNTADGAADIRSSSVRPFVYRYNKTGSTATGFSDIEKLTPAFSAQTSTAPSYGAGGGGSPGASYLYGTLFSSTAAELTDAQVKTLLQTLGWTIGWT